MQQFRFLAAAGVMNMVMPRFDGCTPTGVMKQLILVLFNPLVRVWRPWDMQPLKGHQLIVRNALRNTINVSTGPVKGVSALTAKINFKSLPMRCAEMAIQLKHAHKVCFTKDMK